MEKSHPNFLRVG